ncbi:hypothetical protein TNCV_5004841 [Trichonephila clavipes]|uniref:Uncharacterized protein n=1 Tax=Trichonephila clavipes TaxID=2585209 RepID=A0A8X6RDE3_TRICX|nr:hypothetical protein TNCV_5004841 [Trichonephila clavipes]
MIGLLIWQDNEVVHNHLSTVVQWLHYGIFRGREFHNVEEHRHTPHGVVSRRKNMCCVKKFGQDLLQEDQIRLTTQKVQSNEVIYLNAGPNIDQEMLLSNTLLRTMRVLMGMMRIYV